MLWHFFGSGMGIADRTNLEALLWIVFVEERNKGRLNLWNVCLSCWWVVLSAVCFQAGRFLSANADINDRPAGACPDSAGRIGSGRAIIVAPRCHAPGHEGEGSSIFPLLVLEQLLNKFLFRRGIFWDVLRDCHMTSHEQ